MKMTTTTKNINKKTKTEWFPLKRRRGNVEGAWPKNGNVERDCEQERTIGNDTNHDEIMMMRARTRNQTNPPPNHDHRMSIHRYSILPHADDDTYPPNHREKITDRE